MDARSLDHWTLSIASHLCRTIWRRGAGADVSELEAIKSLAAQFLADARAHGGGRGLALLLACAALQSTAQNVSRGFLRLPPLHAVRDPKPPKPSILTTGEQP